MDPYAILGVPHGASQDEIKKAFRTLAHKHHPDKGGDAEVFKRITAAYTDLQKRSVTQSPVVRGQTVVVHVHFDGSFGNFDFDSSYTATGGW